PDLIGIVEQRVKPDRMAQNDRGAQEKWWQFIRPRPELHAAISGLSRALVISRVANAFAFAFLPTRIVFSEQLIVFPLHDYTTFSCLQCRLHEIWTRFCGSSMKDDLRYTASDCFETFPFSPNVESNERLEMTGRDYYEFRTRLMIKNDEGVTKTYNR